MAEIGFRIEAAVAPHIPNGVFQHAILESASKTTMTAFPAGEITLEKFDYGTLFGPVGELRWRRQRDGRFHLVQTRDDDDAMEGWTTRSLAKAASAGLPPQVVLWGEPDGNEWVEGRIPRAINEYPPHLMKKRVAIRLAAYRLIVATPAPLGEPDEEGTVTITRLVEPVEFTRTEAS